MERINVYRRRMGKRTKAGTGERETEEKNNEIKAIPDLLKLLDVKGSIVTIDTIGKQKKIA